VSIRDQISRLVDENAKDIIDFTQAVVGLASITGEEGPCAERISQEVSRIGMAKQEVAVEPNRPNIIGTLKGDGPGEKLLLNGHIDVVHPGHGRDWIKDPFSAVIEDGYLHGRGAVDMKGGLCGILKAVEIIKKAGIKFPGEIVYTAVVDEQVGGYKGIRYLMDHGYLDGSTVGLNAEPTHMRIEICHKGGYKSIVTNYGRGAHGSRPWLGINAVEKSVDLIMRLRRVRDEVLPTKSHPMLGKPTLNIGMIKGGNALNLVPSWSTVWIDRRFVPGETKEELDRELHGVLEELAANDPEFKYEIEMEGITPPLDVKEDEPIVQALKKGFKAALGKEAVIGGKCAGTDASKIVDHLNIPMPVFGPGDYIKYSLGPNEKLKLDDLLDATKVYALAILDVLGVNIDD